MMRHILSPEAITALACGMRAPAPQACLIAPTGLPQCPPPRPHAAASGAINLPAIATTTDDDLGAAAGAEKQTPRTPFASLVMAGPT